ncbi:trypsin-like peptidase domain-containing protein [Kitasatospora sp. NPDC057015]|uniref:trypsin-like peptidase domain-containing protein n=1 Tax=Kitasatospora sp. NPDC057015 TaxID=3346001 RepID=UPI00363811A4
MTGGLGGAAPADPGRSLVRIHDLAGRLRGIGFVADPQGTVLTAHEVVAGLDRVVLHTPGGQTRVLGADSVLLLPGAGLALLRTDRVGGLPLPPLPLAAAEAGRPVAVPWLPGGRERPGLLRGGVLGTTAAMYAPGEGFQVIGGVLLLDLPQPAGPPPAGAPVLDAGSGAVLGVLCPALRSPHPVAEPPVTALAAVPDAADPDLARLLARNAAGVPGLGRALNLGGVLRLAAAQLAAAGAGPGAAADLAADRVDRPDGLVGEEPRATVTALLGAPGSGRTTELAALALRRAGAARPLPTLWLRGADLRAADRSLAEPVGRALGHAARLLAAELPGAGPAPDPAAVARLCSAAHRPLLVILDAPEEAPAPLDAAWLRAATGWLEECGARLLTACGPDAWEQLRPAPADPPAGEPAEPPRVHRLGPLPAEAADRARRRYGLPAGRLAAADARHPLALRLAGELRAAGVEGEPASRGDLFAGYLDLRCLAVARRIAGAAAPRRAGAHRRGGPPPAAEECGRLRRLATAVAGRVHEAARRMLGPGHGALGRDAFEELFPVAGGWAAAVLAERLFVPAGSGYRPAHEEFADWLQGLHLDLDAALRLLLAEPDGPDEPAEPDELDGPDAPAGGGPQRPDGGGPVLGVVARHRAGPVTAALRALGEQRGPVALDPWLHRLRQALDRRPSDGEAAWWAGRLLAAGLTAGPEPVAHRALLNALADALADRHADGAVVAGADGAAEAARAGAAGGGGPVARGYGRFGPDFWLGLGLPPEAELDLLRRLVRADGPEQSFLAATARRLRADPAAVIPLLCAWFDDPGALPHRPGATVADLAHELLYTHRRLALDDLTDRLADAAHPRADALLLLLAAEEPSALCRAVDRWSHDPRPERHVAAAVHALRTAPHAHGPGAELLGHSALALLAREDEPALHGAALALLVRAPQTRDGYLERALAAYGEDDPFVTAEVLAPALESHPEAVLAALARRLAAPGAAPAEALRVLAAAGGPEVARRGAELAGALLRERPERAALVAVEYLDGRLRRLPVRSGAPADLRALVEGVLTTRPAVRRAFVEVLAVGGAPARGELLAGLLAAESDPAVLTAALERLAEHCAGHDQARVRQVVAGACAALLEADEVLVRCAGRSAVFALLLAQWPPDCVPAAPDGPGLARMRALVAAGRDPQYAAAEAEREPGAGGRPAAPQPLVRASQRRTGLPVPKQGRAHGTL